SKPQRTKNSTKQDLGHWLPSCPFVPFVVDFKSHPKHGTSASRIIRRTLSEVALINRSRVLLTILVLVVPALAQREPVLKQINEPHSYYYREMYLPQLTTGPSAVTWAGDSHTF